MSFQVNFNTHGKDLKDAFESVINNQDDTNWLIYAFDKGTYDLRVQGTGSGGLEELNDEFSDGKVQFAYAKVIDPNTELPKYVFIGWCGSGVPELRKAFFNSQLSDVSKFFKSFHVQINARDEADVDPELIMKRVAESSGANYSVHKENSKPQPRIAPVNSVYKKTEIPNIAAMQRESMKKENAPTPVGTNYKPVQTTPKKLEQRWNMATNSGDAGANAVRAERERFEKEVRDREIEKSRQVSHTPPPATAPPATPARPQLDLDLARREQEEKEKREYEQQQQQQEEEENYRRQQEEEDNYRRQQEEENNYRRQQEEEENHRRQQEEERRRQQEQEERRRQQEQEDQRRQQEQEDQRRQEDERRKKEEEENKKRQQQQQEEERHRQQQEEEERRQQEEEAKHLEQQLNQTADRAVHAAGTAAATATAASDSSQGVSAVVLFAYDASESNEMTLFEGEVVHQIDQVDEGWWFGVSEDGKKQGLFPANYVQILEPEQHEQAPPSPPPAPPAPVPAAPPAAPPQPPVAQQDQGNVAVALYDYQAEEDNEISFVEGDVITQIEFVSEDWWQGVSANGKTTGLFPANYVELQK